MAITIQADKNKVFLVPVEGLEEDIVIMKHLQIDKKHYIKSKIATTNTNEQTEQLIN